MSTQLKTGMDCLHGLVRHDAVQAAWNTSKGRIHTDEGEGCEPSVPPTYESGFYAGASHMEALVTAALGGHTCSKLWGENGLLAATMRCVHESQENE